MIRRAALAGAVAVAVLWPTGAWAHATLESTEPANDALIQTAPGRVTLRFDEAVDAGLGGVQVIAPDGRRIDRGRVTSADGHRTLEVPVTGSAEGTYTVAWRVVSDDGHPLAGSFVYHVRTRTGAAQPVTPGSALTKTAGGVGRFLGFGGAMVALGAAAFVLVVTAPTRRVELRLARLYVAAAVVALVGVALSLLAQVGQAAGRSLPSSVGLVGDAVANTRFGAIGAARLGAAALTVVVGLLPWPRSRRASIGAAAVAAVMVVLPAIGGHAWTARPRWLAVAVDQVHLLAGAVWIGGLAALVVAWLAAASSEATTMGRRFSRVALVAAAVVVASGVASSVIEVRSLSGLTDTTYGRILLLKIAAVAVLVAVAWQSRRRAADARPGLLNTVGAELAVAFVVVGLTATLVARPPARDVATGPVASEAAIAGGDVQLVVDPARVGTNTIHLYFLSSTGQVRPVDAAELRAGTAAVPPRKLRLLPAGPGHFSAYDAALSPRGTWTFEITAVTNGVADTATIEVPIR